MAKATVVTAILGRRENQHSSCSQHLHYTEHCTMPSKQGLCKWKAMNRVSALQRYSIYMKSKSYLRILLETLTLQKAFLQLSSRSNCQENVKVTISEWGHLIFLVCVLLVKMEILGKGHWHDRKCRYRTIKIGTSCLHKNSVRGRPTPVKPYPQSHTVAKWWTTTR